MLAVNTLLHPLALDIGAAIAFLARPFVKLQAGQAQAVVDHLDSFGHIALAIGIFDAQDKSTLVVAGDAVRIQRRAQVTDVHIARWAGGEPGSYH